MSQSRTRLGVSAAVLALSAASLAACGGSNDTSTTTTTTTETTTSGSTPTGSGGSGGGAPALTSSSFTKDFSAMASLKDLAAQGKGKIAVILPDTTTSARYTEFDEPYLTKAFETAGLSSSDFSVVNAQGSDATQLSQAQSAITGGATVLVVDPLDAGVGKAIETYAKGHGVAVIDYDRVTLGGSRSYYVSFDNVKVGTLIGNGFVSCAKDWNVAKPNVIVMAGDPTDNNATLFSQGYNAVLKPLIGSGAYVQTATPAGTWDPPTALTEFQQAYTANSSTNSVLVPNDANAAPIISYLKSQQVKPKTFPVTGQDASLIGLQNVLSGYQCGTAYKPIYLEAQATAALAIYLNAGQTPPDGLVNGSTEDTEANTQVPSVLLTPEWVTTANMKDTVIADDFVSAKQLCAGAMASACKAAGIS
ncbi:MAG: sugar ABC transporter substrate-binding protein [Nocardioidaceae bacterium]